MKINLDHFETLEELERDLICWVKEEDMYSFDRFINQEDVLQIVQLLIKKDNIIKEVREYIEQKEITIIYQELGLQQMNAKKELLEILDKENK